MPFPRATSEARQTQAVRDLIELPVKSSLRTNSRSRGPRATRRPLGGTAAALEVDLVIPSGNERHISRQTSAMDESFAVRRRQRGGYRVHRPECHEITDVVATELRTVDRGGLAALVGPLSPCRKCSPNSG